MWQTISIIPSSSASFLTTMNKNVDMLPHSRAIVNVTLKIIFESESEEFKMKCSSEEEKKVNGKSKKCRFMHNLAPV